MSKPLKLQGYKRASFSSRGKQVLINGAMVAIMTRSSSAQKLASDLNYRLSGISCFFSTGFRSSSPLKYKGQLCASFYAENYDVVCKNNQGLSQVVVSMKRKSSAVKLCEDLNSRFNNMGA